jgi:radical SAM superfamily enzyme YgiQ (UPF0313 family)
MAADDHRAPGAVLLVSCYELGHPPLGIAWPKAFLERAGYHPAVHDAALDALPDALVERARFIAIATPMHTALAIGLEIAADIRTRNPGARIAFLGLYAVLNAGFLLERAADFVLAGELEDELVALVEAIDRGEIPIERAPSPSKKKLRFVPPSRVGLASLDAYAKLVVGEEERLAASVETSRGCKYLCRHCPIPPIYDGRVLAVPEDVVLADIEAVEALGARHITFSDPDFLNAPNHARRIARALHHRFPKITFDFTAKISHLVANAGLIDELAHHGCVFIVSAVESLSDRVLEILDKGHTRHDVFEAFAICERSGVTLRPSLLPFTPWSTVSDYLELLAFIESRDLVMSVDPVQLAVRLLVPPGSLLERDPRMVPHLRAFVPEKLSHAWVHPDPRVDALADRVSALVSAAADAEQDPFDTFQAIAAAASASSLDFGAARRRHAVRARDIPRLTEPWFC